MLRRYKHFEARVERHGTFSAGWDWYSAPPRWAEVRLTLYDDHALLTIGFMPEIKISYTRENAIALVQFLRLFNDRVKLEVERQKLVR
ncbi:hypothetical protein [Thermococcus sp. MAR1]|uniref:hypothetical protein n=1 Tax=Thermococcus sp. MAR1 TaxID=1638263 RepID=UPI00143BCB5D|nr:hypothetical protein [Thermococcus sp. MAR1]NJE10059.1 hypothetical protein [Thermococcus sp. MAR1]